MLMYIPFGLRCLFKDCAQDMTLIRLLSPETNMFQMVSGSVIFDYLSKFKVQRSFSGGLIFCFHPDP